jgi:hypothetical protein
VKPENLNCPTVLVLSAFIAVAVAASQEDVEISEAHVEVDEAQMPFFNPMMMNPMNPMMMNPMMMDPMMMNPNMQNNNQQYGIDYSEIR